MNKKLIYEFSIFSFVWLQVISLFYQLFYWKKFGVDIFQYISLGDVIFSSGDYLINFVFIMIFLWFYVQYAPGFERHINLEYNNFVLGLAAVFGLFIFLSICSSYISIKYESIWVASVAFTAALLRDVAGILLRPFRISSTFENSRTGYLYISVIVGSFVFTYPFSNWSARQVIEDEALVKAEVRYVKIEDCHECYRWVLGRLGDYVFVYGAGKDRVVAIPDSRIESITHHFK